MLMARRESCCLYSLSSITWLDLNRKKQARLATRVNCIHYIFAYRIYCMCLSTNVTPLLISDPGVIRLVCGTITTVGVMCDKRQRARVQGSWAKPLPRPPRGTGRLPYCTALYGMADFLTLPGYWLIQWYNPGPVKQTERQMHLSLPDPRFTPPSRAEPSTPLLGGLAQTKKRLTSNSPPR